MIDFDRFAHLSAIVRVWVAARASAAALGRAGDEPVLRAARATLLRTMRVLGRALVDHLPARPDLRRSLLESAMALHATSTGFDPEQPYDPTVCATCVRTTGTMASLLYAQSRGVDETVAAVALDAAEACDAAGSIVAADEAPANAVVA